MIFMPELQRWRIAKPRIGLALATLAMLGTEFQRPQSSKFQCGLEAIPRIRLDARSSKLSCQLCIYEIQHSVKEKPRSGIATGSCTVPSPACRQIEGPGKL